MAPRQPLLRTDWPGIAIIAGGALMVALWPIFTNLHGPTSFKEDGHLLGMDSLFWGSMMEGPSSLLIALGLLGSRTRLTQGGGRMARIGFTLTLTGLVIPAIGDLVTRAVVPPLLTPVLGAGLMLLALGNRHSRSITTLGRQTLYLLGVLMGFAFVWALAVRPSLIDQIQGYRIYGLGANVLFGAGWMVFGATLVRWQPVHDDVLQATPTSGSV